MFGLFVISIVLQHGFNHAFVLNPKIIGGIVSETNYFPFFVNIVHKDHAICGGSLISDRCVARKNSNKGIIPCNFSAHQLQLFIHSNFKMDRHRCTLHKTKCNRLHWHWHWAKWQIWEKDEDWNFSPAYLPSSQQRIQIIWHRWARIIN